jgi:membrane fusion protein, multidrug efflux system
LPWRPEVSGPPEVLAVKDNQDVRAGGLSLKINPEPFRIELDREEANYELTKADAQKANEEVTIASDRVASRQARLDDPKLHFERAAELRKSGASGPCRYPVGFIYFQCCAAARRGGLT